MFNQISSALRLAGAEKVLSASIRRLLADRGREPNRSDGNAMRKRPYTSPTRIERQTGGDSSRGSIALNGVPSGLAMSRIVFAAFGAALLGTNLPSQAQTVFFHMQGDQGGREAFFSSTIVSDRTPTDMILGPVEIKELDVIAIYEDPRQPEWASLRLQFECGVKYPYNGKKAPRAKAWSDPVKVRLGEGSIAVRRSDLKAESTPSGKWQTADSEVMLKAHKLACNSVEIERAILDSIRGNDFDAAAFNKKISGFGLTEGATVLVNGTPPELLDLAWERLWPGSPRPDPSGKWSRQATAEDVAEAERKMALVQEELAEASSRIKNAYGSKVGEAQDRFAFDEDAAKLRGDRKPAGIEAQLLMVWQSKSEDDVIAKLGPARLWESRGLRSLSYGQQYDDRVIVGSTSGETWVEGQYMSCDVQFFTIPDRKGVWRVADVRIDVDSNAPGWGGASTTEACSGLLQVPPG